MKRRNRGNAMLSRCFSQAFVVGPLAFLLVAGAGCPSLFESENHRATHVRQALVGRDGARTIGTAGVVVNAYAGLLPTTNPAVGDTTITVAGIATLNAGNGLFTTDLGRGDLLLIVQMAGATIDSTDTAAYGTVADAAALGNAGRYELVGVDAVAGDVITLACGLKNAYTGAGKVQVIRVPQYTTLTIESGASITAPAWNGTVGGVVAVHADATLQLDGQIIATGLGFRGGAAGSNASAAGVVSFRSTSADDGGEKGESIAGFGAEYDTLGGRYGRGAPANGGGGGNAHNAGGGGGANARSGTAWNGQGVMLSSVTGAAAWSLDPGYVANGNALTTSQGGGRGGYSYSLAAEDPMSVAPGDASWNGDDRRSVGGLGGHPLDGSAAGRLFLGGGGGAGEGNNGAAGDGGNGGGLVFVIAGTVAGGGGILANGSPGDDANGNPGDAAGGGGGGGSIVVHAGSLSPITIAANGGDGGDHTNSSADDEVEGPGGGGGGGFIAVSGGSATRSAGGGSGGTTNRAAMAAFPSNGATAGNAGLTDGDATTFLYCGTGEAPDTRIATHPDDPSAGATATFTFEAIQATPDSDGGISLVGSASFQCKLDDADWQPCQSSHTTGTLADGQHTLLVRATDLSGNTDGTPATFTWTVAYNVLDGGSLDGEAIDALAVDGTDIDTGTPPTSDAGGDDVVSDPDVQGATDDAQSSPGDAAIPVSDTGPAISVDATVDGEGSDVMAVMDVLPLVDSEGTFDGSDSDALPSVPDVGPDLPGPDVNPDTAPIVREDAKTTKDDAAVGADDELKVLGGGFCAVSQTRSASWASFALLAVAGLAALRRRRR